VLAIRGALSDILSASTFARMQREKPDLVSLTVTARGHAPLLDEPECRAAIDAFLGWGRSLNELRVARVTETRSVNASRLAVTYRWQSGKAPIARLQEPPSL
jgi:hypothetical protein